MVVGLGAVAVLGAACGGDDDPADGGMNAGGGGGVQVSAVDNEFDPSTLEVPAGGDVEVSFTNDGENPHTFTVSDLDVDTGTVEPGGSASVTIPAIESDTEFVCLVHPEMKGTLTAK